MIPAHPTSTAMDIMTLQFPHDRIALWWLRQADVVLGITATIDYLSPFLSAHHDWLIPGYYSPYPPRPSDPQQIFNSSSFALAFGISILGQAVRNSTIALLEHESWLILSACHAGLLGGNRTPVGSAEIIYVISQNK